MNSSITLAQLSTKSKFKRKLQPYAYDSYEEEFRQKYGLQQQQSLPPSDNSIPSHDWSLDDDLDALERNHKDREALVAQMDYETISSSALKSILSCMAHIRDTLKTDPRDQSKVIYPLDMVLIVVLLARLSGKNTAKAIASYYKEHYLELQCLLPDVPSPRYMLSATTINTLMRMFSEEEIQALLTTYFSAPPAESSEMIQCNDQRDRPEGLKDTLGFDGQEMRGSFVRGEQSRKKKGAHGVTVYNCTTKAALGCTSVSKKNQESKAFLSMLPNLSIHGSVIMSDALNSSADVSTAIIEHGADFLLPIKQNAGNKELVNHVEAIYNREQAKPNKDWLTKNYVEKGHGRVESWTIELLPSSKLDPRINNQHQHVASIVRYTKKCDFILNGTEIRSTTSTRYYISSLEFSNASVDQILYSVLDYWGVEAHHGVLDNPNVFNQDAIQGCNPRFLSNTLGINKIVLNILRSVRAYMAMKKANKTPDSFASIQAMLSSRSVAFLLVLLVRYIRDEESQSNS